MIDLDYFEQFLEGGYDNDILEIEGYTEIDFKEEDIQKIKNYLLHMDPRDMLFELYYFKNHLTQR